jgi:hypothetical protein
VRPHRRVERGEEAVGEEDGVIVHLHLDAQREIK